MDSIYIYIYNKVLGTIFSSSLSGSNHHLILIIYLFIYYLFSYLFCLTYFIIIVVIIIIDVIIYLFN